MNPIPLNVCAAGALGIGMLGMWAGWTVADWRHDSAALSELRAETAKLQKQTDRIDASATTFEKERTDDFGPSIIREDKVIERWRDHPVPSDCAVPDAVGRVFDEEQSIANSRITRKSGGGLPANPAPAQADD